jgi:hypothetical protein
VCGSPGSFGRISSVGWHDSTAFKSRLCRPQMTVHLRNRTLGAKRGIRRVPGNQSCRVQLLTYVLSSACEKSDAVPIEIRAISCAFVPSQYHLYLFGDSSAESIKTIIVVLD